MGAPAYAICLRVAIVRQCAPIRPFRLFVMSPRACYIKLLAMTALHCVALGLQAAPASVPAPPATEQVRYRPLEEILKEANRKTAAGATRIEVETWLAGEMRRSGLQVDQAQSKPTEAPAPSWDVYARQRRAAYGSQAPAQGQAGEADNASEPLPIKGLPAPEATETYPLNDQDEAFHDRACRYPSCAPSYGDPANGHRGNQERRDFPVWFSA